MNTFNSVGGKFCLFAAATLCVPFANAQETLIEEILVTAQKREQNIQDVPVAVTAYSGRMLEESGIKDITELASVAPSLNANQSQNSTTSSFSIRGIGTSSQNFGLESSVGLYIDNVYRGRQSAIINNLVDVAAVEVLRGPQGTLFGKNTPSGAINMTTVRPGHDRNAFAEVTAGEYGLVNIAAATNVSLVEDVLAMRATVYSGTRDGFGSDINLGSDKINDRDRAGARLQFYYTPTDELDIRIVADYGEINETCCAALTRQNNFNAFGRTGPGGAPIFGSDALLLGLGGTVFQGERPSPVLQQARGGVNLPGDNFDDLTTALNFLPHSSNNDSGVSIELNYDLEGVTLTSISAYREFESVDDIDADFSNVDLLRDTNVASQRQISQELRLTGEVGEGVTYVAGAYYFEQDLRNVSSLNLGVATNPFLSQNPDLQALVAGVNSLQGLNPFLPPASQFLPVSANAFPSTAFATDDMSQEHSSFALFAQADFELNETWLLTAGLRYTDEKKTLDGNFLNSPLGPTADVQTIGFILATTPVFDGMGNPIPANIALLRATVDPLYSAGWGLYTQPSLAPQAPLREELLDDQLTGTIKLSWFATDTTMIYASYGTGYKSGGTNTDRIAPSFSQTFGPETATAYEIGIKADFPSQNIRVNAAVHDTTVEDLQTSAFSGNGFNLQNAGEADTYGAEIEFWWTPSETFDLQAYYVLSVADFAKFQNGTCWLATPFHTGQADPGSSGPNLPCDRTGGRVPSNPEDTFFVAATKSFFLGNETTFYARGEYTYRSDLMTDGNNDPLKLKDSTDNLNLKFGLIFDKIDAELSIWGRNVTDESDYQTIFDVPVQDGKLMAYPNEPRTWGVTFRKNFQ